ncbi:MAG: hypothetical protein KAH12_07510 [Anaerolineales bacterium]|nr:hypothetical protein [Anaerolineales bacterium]
MSDLLQSLLLALLFLCGTGILIGSNRRWMTGLLALQYVEVFLFVSISWPLEIAVVKLVAGWMASAVLFLTYQNMSEAEPESWLAANPPGTAFKGFAALLVGLSVYSLVPLALRWFLGATSQQVLGGLWLLGLGLLQLVLSRDSLRIIIGLLTVLSGFEILYATLEASVLMTGLLAILNIGFAFLGAYLLIASNLEESP